MKFYVGENHIDVIRANVLADERPELSDDDCSEGFRNLIVRCWDILPEVRLSFKGKEQ